jgi:hypothetical protein
MKQLHLLLPLMLAPLAPFASDAEPYGTNSFYYQNGHTRVFSIDWFGLTPGHTYEVQSSVDAKNWRQRVSLAWSEPDSSAYWRSQFLMLPPVPEGLVVQELFRLADVTPTNSVTSARSVLSVPSLPSTNH